MAQLVLGTVGAVVGGLIGGPMGASIGWAIGGAVGSAIDPQKVEGPRLDDLKVTASAYGTPVPVIFGYPRVAGTVVWASTKREIKTTSQQGKGGGPEVTNYTYEIDLLFLLSADRLDGVRRIWSNGKLVWSAAAISDSETIEASEDAVTWRAMRFHGGADDQLPDPTYEAAVGVGNAPAFRGRATLMLEGVNLGNSGQLPNLTFEVVQDAVFSPRTMRAASKPGISTAGAACCPVLSDGGIVIFEMSSYDVSIPATLTVSRLSGDGVKVLYSGDFDYRYYPVLGWSDVPGMLIRRRRGGTDLDLPGYAFVNEAGLEQTFLSDYTADGQYLGYWYRFGDRMVMRGLSEAPAQGMVRMWNADNGVLLASRDFGADVTAVVVGADFVLVRVGATLHECDRISLATLHEYDAAAAWVQQEATTSADGSIEMVTATGIYGYRDGQLTLIFPGDFGSSNYDSRPARRDGNRLVLVEPMAGVPITVRMREVFLAAVTPEAVPLADVVTRLCLACGLEQGDIDVVALEGQQVRALAVQPTSARAVLEQLAAAYYFECVESDGLYFRRRGAPAVATVPYADYGAEGILVLQDANDLELPAQVSVSYLNLSNAYQQGNELSDRLTTDSAAVRNLQLGMGLTPAMAKAIADTAVLDQTIAARTASAALDLRYAALEPTDVLMLHDSAGGLHRARIVKIADAAGVRSLELVGDDDRVLRELGVTSEDYDDEYVVLPLAATDLVILDIPLLRDQDDGPGVYAAGDGLRGRWPGYQLFRDGVEVGRADSGADMGTVTEVLGDWTSVLVDERNVVTVTLNPGDELVSITHDDMATTATNYAAIGAPGRWEIVQYQRAQLVAEGVYRLSGLARGRLGTEHLRGTHAAGDRFVALNGSGMLRDVLDRAQLGASVHYEGVTQTAKRTASTMVDAVVQGVSLRPLSPVDVRMAPGQANSVLITWSRRSRYQQNVLAGVLPLGEATERYEVDVYKQGAVVRTLASGSRSVAYTLEQQRQDFGSAVAELSVQVYQLSASVGRGRGSGIVTRQIVGAAQQLRAQIAQLVLSGVAVPGATYQITLGTSAVSYVVPGGTSSLAAVASGIAAALASVPGYEVTASGTVVEITGPVGVTYAVAAQVRGGGGITIEQVQQGSPFSTQGDRARAVYSMGSGPADGTFTVRIRRMEAGSVAFELPYSVTYTPADGVDLLYVPWRLADAFEASGDRQRYDVILSAQGEAGVNAVTAWGALGDPDWSFAAESSNPAQPISLYYSRPAVLPLPEQPQVLRATVVAASANARYVIFLGSGFLAAEYAYSATGSDTTSSIASALAAAVDAATEWTASASGSVVTITASSSANPNTNYSASTGVSNTSVQVVIQQSAN